MFRSANMQAHSITFNSATSCDLIDIYNQAVDDDILASRNKPKSPTFAPSSFRCDRINWFRLRGVQPDTMQNPDRGLNFTAEVGTALHEIIQKRLSFTLGDRWLNVACFLEEKMKDTNCMFPYQATVNGYETLVSIDEPPVRFACDGLIKMKQDEEPYLLEIKTSEFSSFQDLTEPKPKHVDQIRCYAALLQLHKVLVLYVDRQYGGIKCFEQTFTDNDHEAVIRKMRKIEEMAEASLVPDKLPPGSDLCSSNMCPYFKKCKEW